MKKKDIIQLVKKIVKEDAYGSATLTTQGSPRTGTIVPTDEYPFSARPKRTATGMMETQGTLSSDMLNYADQYHMELVDTMQGVSTHIDKRTEGFYIKFPHENGPDGRGAMFGKETRLQIEKSKAAAKAAALKTYTKFQNSIEDYEISDSKSGVYGNVWLWIMPKTEHMGENKELTDNPKLQPGKTLNYQGTRYEVIENSGYVLTLKSLESGNELKLNLGQLKDRPIKENNMKKNIKEADVGGMEKAAIEAEKKAIELKIKALNDKKTKMASGTDSVVEELGDEESTNGPGYIGDEKLADLMRTSGTADVSLWHIAKLEEAGIINNSNKEIALKAVGHPSTTNEVGGDERDDEDEERGWMGADDAKDMMREYIKERGNDNLMEHMDKYRKRATLMEGAWKDINPMFDGGKTDEEIVQHYVTKGVAPENVSKLPTLVKSFRNNWNKIQVIKTDLEILDQEADGLKQSTQPAVSGMEGGMEEEKQLASGLFNETK